MELQSPVNMKSMRLLGGELDGALHSAVEATESYLGDSNNTRALDSAITEFHQLSGILKIIELHGVVELTDALLTVLWAVQGGKLAASDNVVDTIGRTLLYLPRYLDKAHTAQAVMPVALVEPANQLRALLRQPPLWESQVAGYRWQGDGDPAISPVVSERSPRCLHHIFQIGLLAVLQGRHSRAHWRMMERALAGLQQELPGAASREWWLLNRALVQAFRAGALELGIGRKRLLTAIDSGFRKLQRGVVVLDEPIRSELAWLVGIADGDYGLLNEARQSLALPVVELSDSDITAARNWLHGPSCDALVSIGRAVDEELKKVRAYLEVISQGSAPTNAMTQISSILLRVADVLKVAGIRRAEVLLRNGVRLLAEARSNLSLSQEDILLSIADILLLVESITGDVAAMEQARAAGDDGVDKDVGSAIGGVLLRRSRLLAIRECEASVMLAKRALSGYQESGFDPVHIDNLGAILITVRGSLQMLGSAGAADIVRCSLQLVNDIVSRQSQELLEALADVLVSLDCYLDDLALTDTGNDELLQIAEASLVERGYPGEGGSSGVAERRVNG